MANGQVVLILGGGFGGLTTAVELRKRLPKPHRVVLVDREAQHLFTPSLLWVLTGQRRGDEICRPLARLQKRGIEVIQGEIERIDPANRKVVVGGETLNADYLVIALGADLAPETVPGLSESGHSFYDLKSAQSLRERLQGFKGGRIAILTAATGYKCPAAPYEAAMLIKDHFRWREDVKVDVYAAEPGPMGVTGPEVSKAVRQMIESHGIGYYPEHQVTSVDVDSRRLHFSNGARAEFELLIYVAPHRAPRVVREAGLVGENGWIASNRHLLATKFDHVFAIGDVTAIPLKQGKPLPRAGVFAHRQGEVVARNIADAIAGRPTSASFDGHGGCFIETGGGKAGFGQGNFYAEPLPDVRLRSVGFRWHLGKILFEKTWLHRWF